MKMLSVAAIALLLLAGCSTTTEPPPSHPTWCNKDPKKEPHFHDCNGNIYLPGHEPEECLPDEPPKPVVQRPVEPPKPDPIVGTYRVFYADIPSRATKTQSVLRIYPNNTASIRGGVSDTPWKKDGDLYRFLYSPRHAWSGEIAYTVRLQSERGEPDLVTVSGEGRARGTRFEAIKLSDSPDHLFDLYKVLCDKGHYKDDSKCEVFGADEIKPGWKCHNIGRKLNDRKYYRFITRQGSTDVAETLEQCEAICEQALLNRFETVGEGNCTDHEP